MKRILAAGVLMGVLCGGWTLVMGYTRWYRDPTLLNLFWAVMGFELLALIWGLRGTAAEGRRYGGQVLAGVLISIVGGVIVMGCSLLFTVVLFPNYFRELAAINENLLRSAGKTEEEIRTAMAAYMSTATPMMNALSGFLGTVITGLFMTLVIAIFVRAKPGREAPASPA